MTDIWGFLLQTLTASGAALLLLTVKAMFRDKLSPRWQFAVWGVLGLVLLLPAGLGGRYALVNWPWLVEAAKTLLTGDYSLTRVLAPIPLPRLRLPGSTAEWLYTVYVLGVLLLLTRYILSYLRLRLALNRGTPAGAARSAQIAAAAARYGLSPCPAVEVPGLSSAFICGVLRPVLALPAGRAVDDKVLLHELLHLKHRDAAWGLAFCLFRCIHWCNPLLWYCADRAGNDLEARCDQRVLELLEGEERRDYGRILLSMSDEKYARAPGTSSMANGGKNIRRRIEAITRFKKYPAGMALASVCVALILAAPMLLGTRARAVYDSGGMLSDSMEIPIAMASARTVYCTTPAGALDAYAKSVLEQNGYYRAMCAPLTEQAEIADAMLSGDELDRYPLWDPGLPAWPDTQAGYAIYNLEPMGEEAYEGALVVKLNYPPDGQAAAESHAWLAHQAVRAERQEGRWIVLPLEEFQAVETASTGALYWGFEELPAYHYQNRAQSFRVDVRLQKAFTVDNTIQEDAGWFFGTTVRFNTVPKPDAEFDTVYWNQFTTCTYTGDPADRGSFTQVGVSTAPMDHILSRPVLRSATGGSNSGSSSSGEDWGSQNLSGDWGPTIWISGGGSSSPFHKDSFDLPRCYAADLYLNDSRAAELTLPLLKGEKPR